MWEEYYKELMIRLKANPNQFIVEKPAFLSNTLRETSTYEYYLTYYLSDENKNSIIKISNILKCLYNKGIKCKARIHPRGNNDKIIFKYLNFIDIETPNEVSLDDSFKKTEYICSLCSTVLYEGYLKGKKVIIDDVSNCEKYEKLKDLEYFMIKKRDGLLSELLK